MDNNEEKEKAFKVDDRRRFSPEGELKPEHRGADPWLSHAAGAKLLVSEYLKYIVAAARIQFEPPVGPTETAYRSRTKI